MPSKASLPSALVDASDVPPQSIDSVEHFSKQSSSRSKLSSNNSSKDEPPSNNSILQKFKFFNRRKSDNNNQSASSPVNNPSSEVNSILYRRPSLVVTAVNDQESPTEEPWPKTSTTVPNSPDKSFLKAPSFIKVN